jgi:hypothetical protein
LLLLLLFWLFDIQVGRSMWGTSLCTSISARLKGKWLSGTNCVFHSSLRLHLLQTPFTQQMFSHLRLTWKQADRPVRWLSVSDLSELWNDSTVFHKILLYQLPWISIERFSDCYMPTDISISLGAYINATAPKPGKMLFLLLYAWHMVRKNASYLKNL